MRTLASTSMGWRATQSLATAWRLTFPSTSSLTQRKESQRPTSSGPRQFYKQPQNSEHPTEASPSLPCWTSLVLGYVATPSARSESWRCFPSSPPATLTAPASTPALSGIRAPSLATAPCSALARAPASRATGPADARRGTAAQTVACAARATLRPAEAARETPHGDRPTTTAPGRWTSATLTTTAAAAVAARTCRASSLASSLELRASSSWGLPCFGSPPSGTVLQPPGRRLSSTESRSVGHRTTSRISLPGSSRRAQSEARTQTCRDGLPKAIDLIVQSHRAPAPRLHFVPHAVHTHTSHPWSI
mmetsp:Transcript_22474/g.62332  ORF Transcript_22474/g.62332 Transcript_22474/m.62332 type:complete len:306 (-) Transcript_22474:2155-3072(-)